MMSMIKFPLIVQPTCGLCNRMRTIASAAILAEMMNRKLVVIWARDGSLNASFKSLFEQPPFRVIDINYGSIWHRAIYRLCRILGYHFYDDSWIYANAREKPFEVWLPLFKTTLPYIRSCLDIIKDHGYYGMFAISDTLQKNIMRYDGGDMIGIHIRRTDNRMSIKYSPTELFVEKIKEEIRKSPTKKFYLATDDPNEENTLTQLFPENIVVYKKRSLERNNPLAIEDAVIDLKNLASCSKIYASYWSSFSDVAALWGGIEKVVLKIPDEAMQE